MQIQYDEVKRYLDRHNYEADLFIETGTSFAKTIIPMSVSFERCKTIELSQEFYESERESPRF